MTRFTFFSAALKFIQNYLSFITFPLANFKRLSNNDINQLINSEIFLFFKETSLGSNQSRGYFRREWTRLAWMAMEGEYQKANLGRSELLREARALIGLDDNFTSRILEKGWTTHFGHLGCLINYRNAQKLGIVSIDRRLVIRAKTYGPGRPIYRTLSHYFDFMDSSSKESIFDMEPLFPLTEKVSFTNTNEGFKELADFFNLVAERQIRNGNFKRESWSFLDIEKDKIDQVFRNFGFSSNQPFVAIHIRETQDKYSARNSKSNNFIPAIKELTSRGILAVRIGSPNSSQLPSIPGLIDLRNLVNKEEQFVHDFVISNCEFLISSQSGPSAVAHAIGVPTLVVDGVAIARYCYSTPALSMTLPKTWMAPNAQKISFENVFDLGLGFREVANTKEGYYLQSNSAEEILLAVREFSNLLDNSQTTRHNPLNFQEMKKSIGGIGNGLISEVFFA